MPGTCPLKPLPKAGQDHWGLSAAVAKGDTFQAPALSQSPPKRQAGFPPGTVVHKQLVKRGAWGGFVPTQPLQLLRKERW